MPPSAQTPLNTILEAARPSFFRRHRRWLIVAGIAVLAALAGLAAGLSGDQTPNYVTETARRGALIATVTATGTVEPVLEVEVGTEISGIIDTVLVRENDPVTAGQVLARLDTTRLSAQVNSSAAALKMAEAQVAEAKAALRQAASDLGRVKSLVANGWRSTAEMDAAEAAHDRAAATLSMAQARVAEAKATLSSNSTNLAKAVIRAPIDGIVLTRMVDPGQTVAAAFQTPIMFTIAGDLRRMRVKAAIDEADIGMVKTGNRASFTVDAYPSRTFSAEVISLRFAATVTDAVVTYEAELDVSNDDLALRPGMTATVDIVVDEVKDRLLIPNAALRYEPPLLPTGRDRQLAIGPGVWVLKDDSPARVAVTPGASDGTWTEVLTGDVKEGAVLIVGNKSADRQQ